MNADTYRITQDTLAILPARHIEYGSKIIEKKAEFLHPSFPLEIIKENCLYYGSSYEGRKASVRYHLHFKQKTPIPINPIKDIYAFPTISEKSYDCIWLFFHAIKSIKNVKEGAIIQLINQRSFNLNESQYSIQQQFDRAGMCKAVFEMLFLN